MSGASIDNESRRPEREKLPARWTIEVPLLNGFGVDLCTEEGTAMKNSVRSVPYFNQTKRRIRMNRKFFETPIKTTGGV